MQDVIATKYLEVERKRLFIDYCENARGHFLRVTEESHGRRNTVIVPSTGVAEFAAALNEVLDAAAKASAVLD